MRHPPQLAEDLAGWLLPAACRDEVLGDLYERYVNFVQYAASVLGVIPRVIVSQIHRNTDGLVFLLTTGSVCYSFIAGSTDSGLNGDSITLLRFAIPAITALLVLLIRNGYADPVMRRQRAITVDIVMAIGSASVTQLVLLWLRSDLMLRHWLPSQGPVCGWLFVILLRAWSPPEMRAPGPIHGDQA